MERIAKITLIGIATAGVLFVVGVGALAYLFSDMCGNDLVAEHLSPDGKSKLVIFQRDCGATTGFSTQASLVAPEAKLPGSSGNLFIVDTDHGIAPSGPGGGPELRVRWEGPKRLLLQHHVKARVFKAERGFNGIEVRYEALP
jgi:hypothetical protein